MNCKTKIVKQVAIQAMVNDTIPLPGRATELSFLEDELLGNKKALIAEAGLVMGFFLLAAVGNGMLIFAYICDYRMRTATNMLVISHISAEFSIALLGILVYGSTLVRSESIFGGLCAVVGSLNTLFFFASLLSLTAVSVDRYLAVVKRIHHKVTRSRVRPVLVLIWFQALVNAVPWDRAVVGKPGKRFVAWLLGNCQKYLGVLGHGNAALNAFKLVVWILSFITPVLIIIYTCFFILRTALKNTRRVHVLGTIVNNRVAADAYSKSAFTTVIIVLVYFLCMVPSVVLRTIADNSPSYYSAEFHVFCATAMAVRSAAYPVIFTSRSRKFSCHVRNFFVHRLPELLQYVCPCACVRACAVVCKPRRKFPDPSYIYHPSPRSRRTGSRIDILRASPRVRYCRRAPRQAFVDLEIVPSVQSHSTHLTV